MKLNYDRKSKDPTYFIQQGIRNGKKTTTKNVCRIGRHSELLKITDDPLAYAKQKVAEYNEDFRNNNKVSMEVKIDFSEKLKSGNDLVSRSTSRNIGYLFLQQVYNRLGLSSFFKSVSADSKISFDLNQVIKFLTFARILSPASKLSTFHDLGSFYEQPSFEYMHIMRAMDLLQEHYDEFISHLFEQSNAVIKRNTSVCYYDCTNFYFETECADEDYVDEVTGEIIKGFRKYGVSKEHRPNPVVEMGLFMDSDGIPLSMCLASGSANEQTTAVPAEKKLISMFRRKEFIYCADGGLGSYHIRNFNSMGGRAFVVTQSVKKLSSVLQEAVFCDCDYRLLSSDMPVSVADLKSFDRNNEDNLGLYNDRAYKVIAADALIDVGLKEQRVSKVGRSRKVSSPAVLKQKIIVTFSRKMMEYQRAVRNRQIERATRLLENIDPEKYKKGPHDVTRFIRRKTAGGGATSAKPEYVIDREAIAREERYDGFYAVATNLDDDAATVLEINARRYKIEDCFRVMKTNFSARPVYHQTRERITAHFMICYTALLVYRLLEVQLDRMGSHFTTDNIIKTLRNMAVTNIDDMFYAATYTSSEVCTALNALYDLGLDKKYYLPKELNKKFRNF